MQTASDFAPISGDGIARRVAVGHVDLQEPLEGIERIERLDDFSFDNGDGLR